MLRPPEETMIMITTTTTTIMMLPGILPVASMLMHRVAKTVNGLWHDSWPSAVHDSEATALAPPPAAMSRIFCQPIRPLSQQRMQRRSPLPSLLSPLEVRHEPAPDRRLLAELLRLLHFPHQDWPPQPHNRQHHHHHQLQRLYQHRGAIRQLWSLHAR